MRRTGNSSLLPTIGSVGCGTVNTVADAAAEAVGAPPAAHPASAPAPASAPRDKRLLLSMPELLRAGKSCVHAAPQLTARRLDDHRSARVTLRPMLSRAWFFAYFWFSHRSAAGEASV